MRKILSLLISLVLVVSLSISAFAAGSAKVDSKVSATVIKLGDKITVTVSLSDCAPFKSMALTPNYDKNVFELVSGEWLLTDAVLTDFNGTSGAVAYSSAVEKSGNIFKYVLKAKDNATLKNTTIKTDAVIKNGDTTVTSTATAVTVKVICKNHSFGAWSKADDNNHKRVCSACDYVETTSHAWDNGKITKSPTCKEAGTKVFTCSICNTTKTESIAKTNEHKFGDYSITKAPTCTTEGVKTRTCSVCGKSETAKVDALGHKMDKWSQTKAPTCEDKGSEERKCSACSHVESRSIAALGHKFSNPVITKEPTCTETGIESGKCTRCGKESTNTLPKKEHTFGKAVIVTPATETAVGKQTKTCTVCNTVVEEEIPMLEKKDVPADNKPDDSIDTDSSGKSNESEDNSWIIWIVIGAVIVVVGVIIFIITKKRSNSKHSKGNNFDIFE